MRKNPRILFFVASAMPSEKDFAEAELLGSNVVFRNASVVPEEGALEKCDGVAGCVPARYASAYQTAEKAIALHKAEQQARAAKISEKLDNLPAKPEAVVMKPPKKQISWTPNN